MRTSTRCSRVVPKWRTCLASGIKAFLMLFLLFSVSQNLSAQCTACLPVSPGHISIDGSPCDWASTNLALIPIHTYVPDPHGNGVLDNAFTLGSKDFNFATDLRWEIGQTKSKTDIANAAVAIVDGNLYFAGDRTSNNGDAQIGFWFYLNGTAPQDSSGVKNFAPEHAVGDLLVLANFTNGGTFADVQIYEWVGTGGNVPNTNGTLSSLGTCSGVIVAQNNSDTYAHPSEWSFDSPCYEANEFYEGIIPLSCITGLGGSVCFKSFLLEARSSQSVTASLDDFVAGGFGAAPTAALQGGTITCANPSVTLGTIGSSPGTYVFTGPAPSTSVVTNPVTVGGVYTLTITNTTGCTATATASVSTNTTAPTAVLTGGTITCANPTVTLSTAGSSSGAGFTQTITGPAPATTVVGGPVSVGGVYTLKVTNTNNGCTATATASVSVNNTAPGATATGGTITCTTTSVNLTGGPSGFSYSWTGPGGFTSTVQSPTGVTAGGLYTLRVTNPANGCTSTATASVSTNTTAPTAGATGNTIQCGQTTTTITGTPATGVTYLWTGPGIVSGGATATATVNAGGVYTLKVTSTTNGCTATATASVSVAQCAVLCTYTQGYYGNPNGQSCSGAPDPTPNTFTTTGLINKSIANWGGTITIGCTGHSVTVSTGQASCVIDVLPGGGASAELPAGNYTVCGLPGSLLSKQGRIDNALLAQTLTLGLNMGINPPALSNFPLQANKWLVTAETVECGSPDVKPCQFSCTPGLTVGTYVWTVTYSPYHVSDCRISQALYDALTTKNVSGLYALANAALCNVDGVVGTERGISLTEIENAVDCINNAFDECRTVVGWFSGETAPAVNSFCTLPSSSTPCPVTITSTRRATDMATASEVAINGLQVSAYPNPYNDVVKFTIQSKVSGQAQLVIYNVLGQRVKTIYNGYMQANKSQVVEYKAPSPAQGNLIYVLSVGGKQVTGKLLQIDNQ